MQTLQQINNRVKQIESDYHAGRIDLAETTMFLEEALREYTGDDRVIPMRMYQAPAAAVSYQSGIGKLDDITGGFRKGDIFTITAASGVGKSTMARELLIRLSKKNVKCLYFSYEDRNEGLLEKLGDEIPDGYIPAVLNDRSLPWIEARILESVLKFKVEAVFVDNLKSITDYAARNVNNSIEATMQKLKEIAMKYGVLMFLCAHVRKEEGKAIDLNSIKDSSAIADTSSLVISLARRPEENQDAQDIRDNGIRMSNLTLVSVIKNRNTGVQRGFTLLFRPKGVSGRFDEDLNQDIVPKEVIAQYDAEGI